MSAKSDARDALATRLAVLTISTPEAMSIRSVRKFPVARIEPAELPGFVLGLPTLPDGPEVQNSYAEEVWTFPAGLFVPHEAHGIEWAAQVLDAFTDALLTSFYASRALGGEALNLEAGTPRILPENAELFGGIQYPHVHFEFDVRVGGVVTTSY